MNNCKESSKLNSINLREVWDESETVDDSYYRPSRNKEELDNILETIKFILEDDRAKEVNKDILEKAYTEISQINNFPRFKVDPKSGYSFKGLFNEQLPPELCLLTVNNIQSNKLEEIPAYKEVSNECVSYAQSEVKKLGMESYLNAYSGGVDPSRYGTGPVAYFAFYYRGKLYRFIIPRMAIYTTGKFDKIKDINTRDKIYDINAKIENNVIFNVAPRIIRTENTIAWEREYLEDYNPESIVPKKTNSSWKALVMVASKLIKEFRENPSRILDYLN